MSPFEVYQLNVTLICFFAEKPRRLQHVTSMLPRAGLLNPSEHEGIKIPHRMVWDSYGGVRGI